VARTNNFDGLRLLGAMSVVVGHAYHLLGRPEGIPVILGYPLQTLGVIVFFAISGYLITASWTRKSNPLTYFAARCLRIFPALIVVVVLSVVLLGPVTTILTTPEYFQNPRTLRYLINIVLQPQYDLPGVFTDLPYPVAVNGSLWTLPAEFFCYLVVPVLCLVPRKGRFVTVAIFLGVSIHLARVPAIDSPVIWGTRISDAAGMWVFFAAGALFRLASEYRRDLFRTDVAIGLVALYACLIGVLPTSVIWVSWIALPYAVLTIGLASTPYFRRTARFGDLSYGVYLYAFPVQQLVVLYIGVERMSLNIALVASISLALAWVSWHAVEHPSLRLKEAITRRLEPKRRDVRDPAITPASLDAEAAGRG